MCVPATLGVFLAEQDAYVLAHRKSPIIERLELQRYTPHKPVWCLTNGSCRCAIRNGAVTGIIGISKYVCIARRGAGDLRMCVAARTSRVRRRSYADPLTPAEFARIAKLPAARFARII